jgi:glycosyltransferase involved in cell wall biosynthesis
MKIGLFTDTYYPSTNGIVVVIDILRENLYKLGHQVYVIAPRPGIRQRHNPKLKRKQVIWVPAMGGLLFDEYKTSILPPQILSNKLDKLNFDAIIFFTPGIVGMSGVYYAKRNSILLLQQYCTDLVEYIAKYPNIIPILLAYSLTMPYLLKMDVKSIAGLTDKIIRKRDKNYKWSQDTIRKVLTTVHNNCDCIISISKKSTSRLIMDGVIVPIETIPTGVDALKYDPNQVKAFRKKHDIKDSDFVLLYVGRTAPEKNLEMLIDAFCILAKKYKHLKLMITGDYEYRATLEKMAKEYQFEERIIFTGRIERQKIGNVYKSADIFVFPSITDAQGLVLNEAAHAGLPIVWCDKDVNEVAQSDISGVLAKNNIRSFCAGIEELINNPKKRKEYGSNGKKLAKQFSERKQTIKIIKLIDELLSKPS